MHVDISKYEANKAFVISWFENKGNRDIGRTISIMSTATFTPCIAIAFWLGQHTQWDPIAVASIKRLIDFYGYTTIEGKPEDSPI